ncbi:MAG: hypothetical protein MI919_38680 [Holophagales bacterium]|nr:hypothetical protein [Holophagales bacterium]
MVNPVRLPGHHSLSLLLLVGLALSASACGGLSAPGTSPKAKKASPDCTEGFALDDGTVENGYGFVPSSKWTTYLQRFDSSDLPGRQVERVCVCFLRTREADAVDFEVVFHRNRVGRPALESYASVPGKAVEIPKGVESGGKFYAVDVSGVTLPEGPSFIGVRFDPSQGRFVFLCSDKSETESPAPGFQMDDRSKDWTDVLNTRDSTFFDHRAAMIRVVTSPSPDDATPKDATPESPTPEDTDGTDTEDPG